MIRLRGSVEYVDGRVEEFSAGPAILAEWELYALRHGYPVALDEAPGTLAGLVIAHSALKIAVGFDPWRSTVFGVQMDDPEAVPPTLPAPSLEA